MQRCPGAAAGALPRPVNDSFWEFFDGSVRPLLLDTPVLADLGCGPGLYLRDVSERLPHAKLYGLDQADEMLAHARSLDFAGEPPTLKRCDVAGSVPLADASVDLLTIAAVEQIDALVGPPVEFVDICLNHIPERPIWAQRLA